MTRPTLHRRPRAWLAAALGLALVMPIAVAPVQAQDEIPAGLPTTPEEEITSAGRTQDTSFCGTEPITLGIHDGIGANAWSQASFAAAHTEALKCPNVTPILAAAGFNLQTAIDQVNSWVVQGVNAITIIPDAGAPGAQLQSLQDATAQGATVVPWASDPAGTAGTDYLTYVDWDPTAAGTEWGTWMAGALGGTGKIVFLGGPAGVAVGLQELEGIVAALEAYPDIEILTGTTEYGVTNWNPADAQATMTALLGQHDQIDGVITNYGTDAVGAIRAFELAGRELVPFASLEANQLACEFDALKATNPKYELATISSRNWMGRIAARKAIAGAQGVANDEPAFFPLPLFEDTLGDLPVQCDPSLAADQYLSNQLTAEELSQYGTPTQ